MTAPLDIVARLRSRSYLVLLILAAVLGVPIAAASYWFLYLVGDLQKWLYQSDYLAEGFGVPRTPVWWPIPLVGISGVLVAATIQYLPGRGGHSPADGFKARRGPVAARTARRGAGGSLDPCPGSGAGTRSAPHCHR